MGFQIGGAILDFVVLSILGRQDSYGYEITQQVRRILDVSETALYPALRRLQKAGLLTTYDQPWQGRNRRYYKITEHGRAQLRQHRIDWQNYRNGIDAIFFGGDSQ